MNRLSIVLPSFASRQARRGSIPGAALVVAIATIAQMAMAASDGADDASLSSLSLSTAERLLRQQNHDVKAAQRALESAQAGVLIAGARQNPNFTVQTSNINPQEGIGAGSPRDKAFDTQFRLDYLIERGNKRELRLGAADAQARAVTEDLSDVLRTQRGLLAAAYYDLLLAQERVRVTEDTAELFRATLAASKTRLHAGDVAASDVDRISIDALRADNDAQQAKNDLRHAQFAVAALLGLETRATEIVASDAWPDARTNLSPDDVERLIEARPDVLAARARVEAAWQARELARSARIRDVTVGVTYDHWPQNGTNVQGTGNSYGFAVSVPLFLGNHFDGDIAKAEADWGAALDLVEKTTAAARAELSRTESDLDAARQRIRRYDAELVAAAKRVSDAQEFAYEKGAIGVLDLLDARRTLRTVRLDAASARADFAKALEAWRAARVGPSTPT
jgi:cobalt-zinc-cadmium efflux system outer membrane protein